MSIFILTLAHLMLFVAFSSRIKFWLINLTFFSALSNEAAGWLTRFVHPLLAHYKIGAFLLLQAALAMLIVAVLAGLLFTTKQVDTGELPKN